MNTPLILERGAKIENMEELNNKLIDITLYFGHKGFYKLSINFKPELS